MCIKLDLIAGNVLLVDSTRIRANASASRTHEKAWYEKQLKEIEERIEQLLEECETTDQREEPLASFVTMNPGLTEAEGLKSAVEAILSEFNDTGRKKINQTDPDCANMSSIQGKHASDNVHSVSDDKNGLIVPAEAVNNVTDLHPFARQVEQAHEVLEKPSEIACADAGYADTEELAKIDAQGTKVIVPSQRQALPEGAKALCKQALRYDKEGDSYFCPQGHRLNLHDVYKETGNKYYQITDKQLCYNCCHRGDCTTGKLGRRIVRLYNEEIKEKLESRYEEAESQEIYAKRKARLEHPFGHIKRNLRTDAFLMRGRQGVQAEASLLATCFNMTRMITMVGVQGLMEQFSNITTVPAVR